MLKYIRITSDFLLMEGLPKDFTQTYPNISFLLELLWFVKVANV